MAGDEAGMEGDGAGENRERDGGAFCFLRFSSDLRGGSLAFLMDGPCFVMSFLLRFQMAALPCESAEAGLRKVLQYLCKGSTAGLRGCPSRLRVSPCVYMDGACF